MPARLAREPHLPEWYFAEGARAIRLFPLDHNLWRVPMDLLKTIPAEQVPGDLAARTLAEARERDPHYFLYQDLHSR
ncbi:MAG: hypothetical protein JNK40_00645 [Chromatiales bacterium]|nr:hypothetical protein [Chromatiales bacterium]